MSTGSTLQLQDALFNGDSRNVIGWCIGRNFWLKFLPPQLRHSCKAKSLWIFFWFQNTCRQSRYTYYFNIYFHTRFSSTGEQHWNRILTFWILEAVTPKWVQSFLIARGTNCKSSSCRYFLQWSAREHEMQSEVDMEVSWRPSDMKQINLHRHAPNTTAHVLTIRRFTSHVNARCCMLVADPLLIQWIGVQFTYDGRNHTIVSTYPTYIHANPGGGDSSACISTAMFVGIYSKKTMHTNHSL